MSERGLACVAVWTEIALALQKDGLVFGPSFDLNGIACPPAMKTWIEGLVDGALLPAPDKHVEALRAELKARCEHGLKKYGTNTERTDLDDAQWDQHLLEELLDAAVYLKTRMARAQGEAIYQTRTRAPNGKWTTWDAITKRHYDATLAGKIRSYGLVVQVRVLREQTMHQLPGEPG